MQKRIKWYCGTNNGVKLKGMGKEKHDIGNRSSTNKQINIDLSLYHTQPSAMITLSTTNVLNKLFRMTQKHKFQRFPAIFSMNVTCRVCISHSLYM